MKENKFLKLAKTLDKQELKAFHKYLNGLYGKQEKMILLFSYFLARLKKDEVVLPTEKFFQTNFFDKPQSAKVIGNLFADLYKYLEEFLRWQKINAEANNYVKDKLQIEIFKERKLDDWFYSKIEKTTIKIEAAPKDMHSFLKLFELKYAAYFKFSTEKQRQGIMKLLSEGLLNLDSFYIAAKLKYALEIKSITNSNQIDTIDNWLIDYILKQYWQKVEEDAYLSVYHLMFQLVDNKSDSKYFHLKNEFLNRRYFFSTEDQFIILMALLNFITQKIRAGGLEFRKEALELYKIGVEDKTIIINNEIGAVLFFNIINVACVMNEIKWAEQFLENYSIYLNNKDKTEIKKLAKGIIYFEKKEFDEVLVQLRDIRFKNIFYETRARVLIIRSLIEQAVDKAIIRAECDAFSQSLRRNELLADTLLIAYKNFVRLTRMIFVNTKTTKEQLVNFLINEKLFVYKIWLQKKVDNFKEHSYSIGMPFIYILNF